MIDDVAQGGLLIGGARVYTADPRHPWAEAVLTRGNRILYVGNLDEARRLAGPRTEQIDLPGALLVPGLNDSHIHVSLGAEALGMLDLEGVMRLDDLQTRLRSYAAAHPDRPWIEGFGLPYEALAGLDRPTRLVLDEAVPARPLYLRAIDWHSAWVNTPALRLAGAERGADLPLPSEVVVGADGLATGMLKERLAGRLIEALIAEPSDDQRDEMWCAAMRHLNRLGITSVQNMEGDMERLARYTRLCAAGRMTVRTAHYLNVRDWMPRAWIDECAEITRRYRDPWNQVRGIKLFIDGVVESKTAMMLEPYADGSGDLGMPDLDLGFFREAVLAADRLDMDVATHAIGDRAVRTTLNTYEEAISSNPGRHDRRHRIEHIEVSHPDDVARFGRLGVTASMQPLHAVPTGDPRYSPWTTMIGLAREPYAFVWRRLVASGAALAFGSDWPVVTADARPGIFAALARTSRAGQPRGGWQPQLCLTLAEVLDAYTIGAARAEGQDVIKGMLRPGMLADLTAFSQDLFTMRPDEIPAVSIDLTVVDGQVVHREA